MKEWLEWLMIVGGVFALMFVLGFVVSVPFAFIGWIVIAVVGIFVDFTVTYPEYVAAGIVISYITYWRTK